jgi:hypothetical protein
VVAKQIASNLSRCEDDVAGRKASEMDKRRVQQRHGVLAICRAALTALTPEGIFGSRRRFDSVEEFLGADDEGWIEVMKTSVSVGSSASPKLDFSIFLYR